MLTNSLYTVPGRLLIVLLTLETVREAALLALFIQEAAPLLILLAVFIM